VSDSQQALFLVGLVVAVSASALIVVGLSQVPAVMRKQRGASAIIVPAGLAWAALAIGGGLAQVALGVAPFVVFGMINIAVGIGALIVLRAKFRR